MTSSGMKTKSAPCVKHGRDAELASIHRLGSPTDRRSSAAHRRGRGRASRGPRPACTPRSRHLFSEWRKAALPPSAATCGSAATAIARKPPAGANLPAAATPAAARADLIQEGTVPIRVVEKFWTTIAVLTYATQDLATSYPRHGLTHRTIRIPARMAQVINKLGRIASCCRTPGPRAHARGAGQRDGHHSPRRCWKFSKYAREPISLDQNHRRRGRQSTWRFHRRQRGGGRGVLFTLLQDQLQRS